MKIQSLVKSLACLFVVLIISSLFFYYKEEPVFPRQTKIGATYMTMNNDFYKYLNAEVEKMLMSNTIYFIREIRLLVLKNRLNKFGFLLRRELMLSLLIQLMVIANS